MVAKWLGLKKPAFTRRYAFRAYAYFKSGHGFEPKFLQFFGKGVRSGFIPCDDKTVYWFMAFTPSSQGNPFILTRIIVCFIKYALRLSESCPPPNKKNEGTTNFCSCY